MRVKSARVAGLFFSVVLLLSLAPQAQAQDGEKLFKANCASCHKPDKKLVGPALKGAKQRWIENSSEENFYAWVKNSQEVIASGDAYANQIFEEYNQSIMTAQAVSNEEIDAIVEYVEGYVRPGPPTPVTPEGETAEANPLPWIIMLGAIFLILIGVLGGISTTLARAKAASEGVEYVKSNPIQQLGDWMYANNKLSAIIILLLLAVGGKAGFEALTTIAVYEGYAPEQPIKFSHKIHAGENKIACQYCHNSVEKGKSAGIPSVNICMNCHAGIPQGKRWGTTEIAKIYEAAGWDADELAYTKPEKPIKWVRIHNLPDFAYFNHSQHVVVGQVACQKCHGKVEEMDVLAQHAPLTMGWCINCHRETEVQMEGNDYYDDLHADLLEVYKEEGKTKFTVADMGGLECVKCHY